MLHRRRCHFAAQCRCAMPCSPGCADMVLGHDSFTTRSSSSAPALAWSGWPCGSWTGQGSLRRNHKWQQAKGP